MLYPRRAALAQEPEGRRRHNQKVFIHGRSALLGISAGRYSEKWPSGFSAQVSLIPTGRKSDVSNGGRWPNPLRGLGNAVRRHSIFGVSGHPFSPHPASLAWSAPWQRTVLSAKESGRNQGVGGRSRVRRSSRRQVFSPGGVPPPGRARKYPSLPAQTPVAGRGWMDVPCRVKPVRNMRRRSRRG